MQSKVCGRADIRVSTEIPCFRRPKKRCRGECCSIAGQEVRQELLSGFDPRCGGEVRRRKRSRFKNILDPSVRHANGLGAKRGHEILDRVTLKYVVVRK